MNFTLNNGQEVSPNHILLKCGSLIDFVTNDVVYLYNHTLVNKRPVEELKEIVNDLHTIKHLLLKSKVKFNNLGDKVIVVKEKSETIKGSIGDVNSHVILGGSFESNLANKVRLNVIELLKLLQEINHNDIMNHNVLPYLNAVLDYFYFTARLFEKQFGVQELIWKSP